MTGGAAPPAGVGRTESGRGAMRRIIVTPTFRPHFGFNREFLDSYREHAADAREVAVHFVVTRAAMDALRAILAACDHADATVCTEHYNAPARALYEGLGFATLIEHMKFSPASTSAADDFIVYHVPLPLPGTTR